MCAICTRCRSWTGNLCLGWEAEGVSVLHINATDALPPPLPPPLPLYLYQCNRFSTSTSTDAPALLYLALIAALPLTFSALFFFLTIAIVVQVLHVMVECKCINPESLPHSSSDIFVHMKCAVVRCPWYIIMQFLCWLWGTPECTFTIHNCAQVYLCINAQLGPVAAQHSPTLGSLQEAEPPTVNSLKNANANVNYISLLKKALYPNKLGSFLILPVLSWRYCHKLPRYYLSACCNSNSNSNSNSNRIPKGLSGIVCRCVHRMLWTIIWSTLNLALQKPKWYSVFEITSLSICDICLGQFSVGPFLRAPAIPSKTRLEANLFKRMIHSVAKTFQ